MFFTRHDGALRKGVARRIKSPRASVYLEFAIVMPIVAMIIAFLFEFISLWDARCMANHAAWVCSRIASVEAGKITDEQIAANKYYRQDSEVKKNDLLNEGMRTATKFLMATCSMGGMGVRVGETPGFTSADVDKVVKNSYNGLVACYTFNKVEKLKNMLGIALAVSEDDLGFVAVVKEFILEGLNAAIDAILAPIEGALNQLTTTKIFGGVEIDTLNTALCEDARLWQFGSAANRMTTYGDRIFDIRERTDKQMYFRISDNPDEFGVDFPRQASTATPKTKWMIDSDQGWPPLKQSQRMIDVKIYWPFERAWLWQALSHSTPEASDTGASDTIAALGRALAYPQPLICNAHLKSEGALAFAAGESKAEDAISDLKNEYYNFLRVVWFWYSYRTREEALGDFDLDTTTTGSYHFLSSKNSDLDSGSVAANNWNGLYNWMINLIDSDLQSKLESGNELDSDTRDGLKEKYEKMCDEEDGYKLPKSYKTSFKKFFNGNKEATSRHHFGKLKDYYKPDDETGCYQYHSRNWFYFHIDDDEDEERQRYAHWMAETMVRLHFEWKVSNYLSPLYSLENSQNDVSASVFLTPDTAEAKCTCRIQPNDDFNGTRARDPIKKAIKDVITGRSGYSGWLNAEDYAEVLMQYQVKKKDGKKSEDGVWIDTSEFEWIDNGTGPAWGATTRWVMTAMLAEDRVGVSTLYRRYKKKNNEAQDKWVWSWSKPQDTDEYTWKVAEHYRGVSKPNAGFSLDSFVASAYDYYTKNMYDKKPYWISAWQLIGRTSTSVNADRAADVAVYNGLIAITNKDVAVKDRIVKCRKELGDGLGVESGDTSTVDVNAMSGSSPFDELQSEEYLNDPEKMRKKAEELLNEQKTQVFAALQEVDKAEKDLIDFGAESRFTSLRDERMSTLYTWIAREIVAQYGSSIGWKFGSYNLSGFMSGYSVPRDNKFREQTQGLENLRAEWVAKIDALYAADGKLGNLLGLTAAKSTTDYDKTGAASAGLVVVTDPNNAGGTTAGNGSKDDKRGGAWNFNATTQRWTMDPNNSTW